MLVFFRHKMTESQWRCSVWCHNEHYQSNV